jgi:DNA-damage-inducible protein J
MAVKTAIVRTRVEPKLKREANKILNKLGLSESEGVRLLLKSLVLHKGLPYELKIPNAETRKAIDEVDKGIYSKGYKDVDEMFADLEK